MFDPHYYQSDDGEFLFAIGREVYHRTRDEDIALPIIKSAADYGWPDAAQFLARYWLGKTDMPEPHLNPKNINYRKAAEFALACRDEELLLECLAKCAPGELDDIKARGSAHCKNFDPVKNICIINNDVCNARDWCKWQSYTKA